MKVSVITPLYNAERWLEETVVSLQQQSYEDWEMLIVDDRSTDKSYELALKLAAKDDRIKVFQLSANEGAAAARNKAIEAATGRYIAFLDSDDLWHPQKLEQQISLMQRHNYAFTYTAYQKIDETGAVFQLMGVPKQVGYKQLLKTCVVGCLTAVYDTEKLGKVYMPINTKREDFATWLSILKRVDYAYGLNQPLAQYRVYANQASSKKLNMAKENWKLYHNIEGHSFIKSFYYFSHYAIRGVLRAKFPKLARTLGVLHK